ncbi:MAG: hypothetical protein RIS70_340, partial [Planctomycetota bacterium]
DVFTSDSGKKVEESTASLSLFSISTPVPRAGWGVGEQFQLGWCNLTLSAMTCWGMAGSGTRARTARSGWHCQVSLVF